MKAVIVGFGSIGKRHASNLHLVQPDCEIFLLRHQSTTEPLPEYISGVYLSITEAVALKPDIVFICGPATAHIVTALAFARSDAHLFIEKPLSDSLAGVDDLVDEVMNRDLVAIVGYTLSFTPAMQLIKRCLDEGTLGTVLSFQAQVGQYLPDWRPSVDYRKTVSARAELGGGALLELSHELQYLLSLFGPVKRLSAHVRKTGILEIQAEDLAQGIIEFGSGVLGSFSLDFLQRTASRTCKIVGSEATLDWDAVKNTLSVHAEGKSLVMPGSLDSSAVRNDVYIKEVEHFLACVRGEQQPLVPLTDGRMVIQVIEALKKAAKAGITVEL